MKDNALGIVGTPDRVPGGAATWRAVVRVLRSPVTAFEDVMTSVFPGDCRVCGGPLSFALGVGAVCDGCLERVTAQRGLLCARCGEAMGMESERYVESLRWEAMCSGCRLVPPDFARAAAFGVYEGELREMTHLLKYEGVRSLAGVLGERLAEVIERLGLGDGIVMVAVPLYPVKERARGYNQAVLLGAAAARLLRGRLRIEAAHGCLRRVRDTESQFALSPKSRRVNLRGAFAVRDAGRLAGREVLLVDDIYTTGATARECARVLRRAGAAKVWVATLARAQREQVALWNGGLRSRVSFGQVVGVQNSGLTSGLTSQGRNG